MSETPAFDLKNLTPPPPPGYEDWVYRDVPWLREDFWSDFMNLLGVDNYLLIAGSRRTLDDGRYFRGQFFISPQGMENLRVRNEENQRVD